jgi:uncharacterized protein (DUF305 family)
MKTRSIVAAALIMVPTLVSMHSLRAEEMKGINMSAKPTATPVDKALAASMQDMMKAMNVKPTGDPDKDFVLMMTPHHQGAVDMAKVELQYGTDAEMCELAQHIVTGQEKDIAKLKDWLAKHGK